MELLQYTDRAQRAARSRTEKREMSTDTAKGEYMPDGISPLVAALCYEHHLHMHGMLAVFAEQRGDDPVEALGPSEAC